eukprot:m51a1_g3872 hypothetical protein (1813) ;mRNA; f:437976-445367
MSSDTPSSTINEEHSPSPVDESMALNAALKEGPLRIRFGSKGAWSSVAASLSPDTISLRDTFSAESPKLLGCEGITLPTGGVRAVDAGWDTVFCVTLADGRVLQAAAATALDRDSWVASLRLCCPKLDPVARRQSRCAAVDCVLDPQYSMPEPLEQLPSNEGRLTASSRRAQERHMIRSAFVTSQGGSSTSSGSVGSAKHGLLREPRSRRPSPSQRLTIGPQHLLNINRPALADVLFEGQTATGSDTATVPLSEVPGEASALAEEALGSAAWAQGCSSGATTSAGPRCPTNLVVNARVDTKTADQGRKLSMRAAVSLTVCTMVSVAVMTVLIPTAVLWARSINNLSNTAMASLEEQSAMYRASVMRRYAENFKSQIDLPVSIVERLQAMALVPFSRLHNSSAHELAQAFHSAFYESALRMWPSITELTCAWKNAQGEHAFFVVYQQGIYGIYDWEPAAANNMTLAWFWYNHSVPTGRSAGWLRYNLSGRPWWRHAIVTADANGMTWTGPFYSITPGMQNILLFTILVPDPTGSGTTILLLHQYKVNWMSSYFHEMKHSPNGWALLLNAADLTMIAGSPGYPSLSPSRVAYNALHSPNQSVVEIVTEWKAISPGGVLEEANFVVHAGLDVFVDVAEIQEPGDLKMWLILVTPISDLLGEVTAAHDAIERSSMRTVVILIGVELGVMALSVLGSGAMGALLVTPLLSLSNQMKKIAAMNLSDISDSRTPRSSIREVYTLELEADRMSTVLSAFSIYVPTAVVKYLVQNRLRPAVGVKKMHATVMFLDVANFTHSMEIIGPTVIISVLEAMFDVFSTILVKNGATIDKYIGDSIMTMWGCPEPVDHTEKRACESACDIMAALVDLNKGFQEQYGFTMSIRMGWHSGEVYAGNEYATVCCTSDSIRTSDDVSQFSFRCLGRAFVKGFASRVLTHEFLGRTADLSEEQEEQLRDYAGIDNALTHDDEDMDRVLSMLKEYVAGHPDDETAALVMATVHAPLEEIAGALRPSGSRMSYMSHIRLMRVLVAVRELEISVFVGAGGQLVRWLAFAACRRYCEAAGLYPDELQPLFIGRPASSGTFHVCDPYLRVCDTAADGSKLWVIPEGDEVPLDVLYPGQAEAPLPVHDASVEGKEGEEHPEVQVVGATPASSAKTRAPVATNRRTYTATEAYNYDDTMVFAQSLARVLGNLTLKEVVCWSRSGKTIIIYDKEAFARDVMPRVFPYSSIDQFQKNLERCGFIKSYPPAGEEAAPRYANEVRMEFVSPFCTKLEISPETIESNVATAVKLFKQLGAQRRKREGFIPLVIAPGGRRRLSPADFGEAEDRQILGPLFQVISDGAAFNTMIKDEVRVYSLLSKDEPHEDAAVLRQVVTAFLPQLVAAFRYYSYAHGDHPACLTMSDFVGGVIDMGLVSEETAPLSKTASFRVDSTASSRANTANVGPGQRPSAPPSAVPSDRPQLDQSGVPGPGAAQPVQALQAVPRSQSFVIKSDAVVPLRDKQSSLSQGCLLTQEHGPAQVAKSQSFISRGASRAGEQRAISRSSSFLSTTSSRRFGAPESAPAPVLPTAVLNAKDAEIVFMEANSRSAGGGDNSRQMVFPEFMSALMRLSSRYAERTGAKRRTRTVSSMASMRGGQRPYRLSEAFESLVGACVLPKAEAWRRADYSVLRVVQLIAQKEQLSKAVQARDTRMREAYYAVSAPDTRLSYEKLRAAVLHATQDIDGPEAAVLTARRAFAIACASHAPSDTPMSTAGTFISPTLFSATVLVTAIICSKQAEALAELPKIGVENVDVTAICTLLDRVLDSVIASTVVVQPKQKHK